MDDYCRTIVIKQAALLTFFESYEVRGQLDPDHAVLASSYIGHVAKVWPLGIIQPMLRVSGIEV